MNTLTKKRLAATSSFVLALALLYPAWQAGKGFASHLWAETKATVSEQSKQITLVVGPMLPISIAGKSVHALGTDVCPAQQSIADRWLYGESTSTGMRGCIVVSPTTKNVRVSLLSEGALQSTEEWSVERNADKLSFRRPDGSPVIVSEKAPMR